MPPRHSLAALFALLTPLAAQDATYTPFGSACPGTGTGLGANHVAPQAFANTFMPSNNVMCFTGAPARYQQVFLGSEFPTAFVMAGVALRWDNQNLLQMQGALVDLEIHVGYTTKTPATLSTTFAANFDSGAPVTVLPRSNVDFPSQDNPPAVDPTQFQLLIPWPSTFSWVPQAGRNLLVEFVQRGNSNGAWAYVLDCGWSSSTARLYGSDTAVTGSLDGFGYGYVMAFPELTHTALPQLTAADLPQFGSQMPLDLDQARGSTVALLVTGLSRTSHNGTPLPFSLAGYGAPGCSVLAAPASYQLVNVNAAGHGRGNFNVPMNFSLLGVQFFNQYLVVDPAANGLGFAVSNGGIGTIGN